MKNIASVTPRVVHDLYCGLSPDDKANFRRRLAGNSTAKELVLMVGDLPQAERLGFSRLTFWQIVNTLMPFLIAKARDLAQQQSPLGNTEFEAELRRRVQEFGEDVVREATNLERQRLKAKRDPKPRNTERDDEIVRLHDQEGKTFGQIPRLLLQKNPKWCAKSGKQLARDTVEKAYHRRKALGTN